MSRRGTSVTLVGYYGHHNLGDDLMLQNVLQALLAYKGIYKIRVCTVGPLAFQSADRTTVIRSDSILGRMKKFIAIAGSDIVIWGGGTCLYEDRQGGLSGMSRIRRLIRLTHLFGGKFIMLGIGVGSISTPGGFRLFKTIVHEADEIYCRDNRSASMVDDVCGAKKAKHCGDLACLSWQDIREPRPEFTTNIRHVAFCGTYYHAKDTALISLYSECIKSWIEAGVDRISFIPMHQGKRNDNDFHKELSRGSIEERSEFVNYCGPSEAAMHLSKADVVVAFRLHAAVLSQAIGVPYIGVNYSSKVSAFLIQAGPEHLVRLKELGEPIGYQDLQGAVALTATHSQSLQEVIALNAKLSSEAIFECLSQYCNA